MSADIKRDLRDRFSKIRWNITNRDELEKSICRYLLSSDLYNNCSSVFAYAATGSEASVDRITEKALYDGKKVALPVCLDKTGNMEFYYIKSLDDIKKGMYNIREPDAIVSEKAYSDCETLCLVPGICFDKRGNRLGYGKGYYDRFLAGFNGVSVGIAFEESLTDDLIKEEFDKNVSYLITDKKIYDFHIKEE